MLVWTARLTALGPGLNAASSLAQRGWILMLSAIFGFSANRSFAVGLIVELTSLLDLTAAPGSAPGQVDGCATSMPELGPKPTT
jgi:hypothetical protein